VRENNYVYCQIAFYHASRVMLQLLHTVLILSTLWRSSSVGGKEFTSVHMIPLVVRCVYIYACIVGFGATSPAYTLIMMWCKYSFYITRSSSNTSLPIHPAANGNLELFWCAGSLANSQTPALV
jgi:hypothetical protein